MLWLPEHDMSGISLEIWTIIMLKGSLQEVYKASNFVWRWDVMSRRKGDVKFRKERYMVKAMSGVQLEEKNG